MRVKIDPRLQPEPKPCARCGTDLRNVHKTIQMFHRSKFCGEACWAVSVRTTRVITDRDGTWVVTASGRRSRISPEDAAFAGRRSWYVDSVGYLASRHGCRFHRAILGSTPKGFDIDHINRDQLDNRRENLRVVTHAANIRNHKVHEATKRSASGIVGVRFDPRLGAWDARIGDGDRHVYLGRFRDRDSAVAARRKAEDELWGDNR